MAFRAWMDQAAQDALHWLSNPRHPKDVHQPNAEDLPGCSGQRPLPWWAAGTYAGHVRHCLLRLRDQPSAAALEPWLQGLIPVLKPALASGTGAGRTPLIVVPIPSWKRRANPLPKLLANQLCHACGWYLGQDLLHRSRPVVGQHHLGRQLRLSNQQGSFEAPTARAGRWAVLQRQRARVLVIDDILTTGATACAARDALEGAGWRVMGLACLARTPFRNPTQPGWAGRDLRSACRQGGGPG